MTEPSPFQRQPRVETPEFAAAVRRMLVAYGRRVADADIEDLAELMGLEALLAGVIRDAVISMRLNHGRSWTEIARAAGTSRQAAHQRWANSERSEPAQNDQTGDSGPLRG